MKLRAGSWWQSREKKLRMISAARGWLAANNGAASGVTARIASGSLNLMRINVISLGLLTQKYRIGARRFEVPLRVRIPP
jgi:hypothetical protein